ncbi:hypothetical protein [Haloarcula onubensis]|uniref:Uncharacterized protein n=1 Tax=Haloarcula onubensis TaxID=2950539 RepID=A0ABU2FRE0_9EURY|nr:hypothetical protein [Halomicroarcula sp. S3CR25-11]MDS0283334.1 hypothetical protein [Halomicroarcula sp. S3CR25-11]
MSERPSGETGSGPQFESLLAVVGWIAVGAVSLAAVLLALDSVVALPFSREVALGLGIALGGGIGGVARLFRVDERAERPDQTMTVDVDPDETTAPEPADLFDGHPDPVLYYAAEGHGAVVRAANEAFGETFDVPVDRIEGTPLSEALLVTGEGTVAADAVTAGGLDRVVDCETAVGTERVRLRTITNGQTGYLLYTPRSELSSAGE